MKRISYLIVLCFVIVLSSDVYAQRSTDLRINEIHPINKTGITDCNGSHCGWVEIFNTSYNSVDLSGLFLSNDPNIRNAKKADGKYDKEKVRALKKSRIPSDYRMLLPLRSHIMFFMDGDSSKSIFHGNFCLDTTGGIIALIDGNETTIIDVVEFEKIEADKSYMRIKDGGDEWSVGEETPFQKNSKVVVEKSSDQFKKFDPIGIGMAIMAMIVVMIALVTAYLVFKHVSKLYRSDWKNKKDVTITGTDGVTTTTQVEEDGISGEVVTAIGLALSLHVDQQHDLEDTIITLQKVSRSYSPWSSKIHMLTPKPQKTFRK